MSIIVGGTLSRKHPTPKTSFDPIAYGTTVWLQIHEEAAHVGSPHDFLEHMKVVADEYKCNKCKQHFKEPGGLLEEIEALEALLADPLDEADGRNLCILWASKVHADVSRALRMNPSRRLDVNKIPSEISMRFVKLWDSLQHEDLLDLAVYKKESVSAKLRFFRVTLSNFN